MHAAFLNLAKAFYRVPQEVICGFYKHTRSPKNAEHLTEIYRGAKGVFGVTNEFLTKVGVPQRSVLSQLLFISVLGAIARDIQKTLS